MVPDMPIRAYILGRTSISHEFRATLKKHQDPRKGPSWWIEFDICFGTIHIHTLHSIMEETIFLSGVSPDFANQECSTPKYSTTYRGEVALNRGRACGPLRGTRPKGRRGVISPNLTNIYLDRLERGINRIFLR